MKKHIKFVKSQKNCIKKHNKFVKAQKNCIKAQKICNYLI